MTLLSVTIIALTLTVFVNNAEGRVLDSLDLNSFFSRSSSLGLPKAIKRTFDPSCKGIYDRDLFSQLDKICENCHNLYRTVHVASECRRNCYSTEIFEGCLRDMMMHDLVSEYKEKVHMVAGKK